MSRRINARIDEELAQKLEQLEALTGKSTSAILKSALDAYYAQVRAKGEAALRVLETNGFIGCGEGAPDLSANYKDELSRSWSKKT